MDTTAPRQPRKRSPTYVTNCRRWCRADFEPERPLPRSLSRSASDACEQSAYGSVPERRRRHQNQPIRFSEKIRRDHRAWRCEKYVRFWFEQNGRDAHVLRPYSNSVGANCRAVHWIDESIALRRRCFSRKDAKTQSAAALLKVFPLRLCASRERSLLSFRKRL
jgi:hypothetical protein